MRRLFIIRKDLHLSAGKLAAMIGHCCEAYWTRLLKHCSENHPIRVDEIEHIFTFEVDIDKDIWYKYCLGIFTKTICEAKNLDKLLQAKTMALHIGLKEDVDFGLINDKCLTELTPENPDGTTTVGIWFKPLEDEVAHSISKKYKLYKD